MYTRKGLTLCAALLLAAVALTALVPVPVSYTHLTLPTIA